jgi:hypothetical protein
MIICNSNALPNSLFSLNVISYPLFTLLTGVTKWRIENRTLVSETATHWPQPLSSNA